MEDYTTPNRRQRLRSQVEDETFDAEQERINTRSFVPGITFPQFPLPDSDDELLDPLLYPEIPPAQTRSAAPGFTFPNADREQQFDQHLINVLNRADMDVDGPNELNEEQFENEMVRQAEEAERNNNEVVQQRIANNRAIALQRLEDTAYRRRWKLAHANTNSYG